ncbi:hypothetical protein TIFTF001_054605, partial [Ficus carica]
MRFTLSYFEPTHDLSFAASLPSTPRSLQSRRSRRSEEKGNLSSVTGFKAWRERKTAGGGIDVMEWLRGEKLGDDFDFIHGGSDGRGGESVGGYGVCELGGEESGGGKEFDSAGGGGEDDGREGMEIPMAGMVKARRRCWVEEAILL